MAWYNVCLKAKLWLLGENKPRGDQLEVLAVAQTMIVAKHLRKGDAFALSVSKVLLGPI